MLEEQKKREDSRRRQKLREDRMRQISEKKKIQEKEAEELRDNKGAEKTERNGLNFLKKREEKIVGIVVYMIYHICAGEKHPQETQEMDHKDRKSASRQPLSYALHH